MSFRARRGLSGEGTPFSWDGVRRAQEPVVSEPEPEAVKVAVQAQLATLEREAFAKGYEQGERSGAEAAGKRGEAMLRRLAETLNDLTVLRADMIRQTERQIVELALAVAR